MADRHVVIGDEVHVLDDDGRPCGMDVLLTGQWRAQHHAPGVKDFLPGAHPRHCGGNTSEWVGGDVVMASARDAAQDAIDERARYVHDNPLSREAMAEIPAPEGWNGRRR